VSGQTVQQPAVAVHAEGVLLVGAEPRDVPVLGRGPVENVLRLPAIEVARGNILQPPPTAATNRVGG
jgi:hypothetical protein